MRYAQINEKNICIADSYLSGEVKEDYMIPLTEQEASPLGKKYVNGVWQEVETELQQQPQSDAEMIMQSMTELELQNYEAQQERQMLAQQIADLERSINHV